VPQQKPGCSKQNYQTPEAFLTATIRLLDIGGFKTDLAASHDNAVAGFYFTEADDSLKQDWTTLPPGWAWLNPPFDHIEPWVKKAYESKAKIAILIPASVGANWWRDWVHGKAQVLFLNGRLSFMPDKPKWLYPKDCALLLYGNWGSGYHVWSWRA
jgi:site-specific DNA-methyltransferase (adenine-specific)